MSEHQPQRQILSISQLNRRSRQLLETHLSLLWVRGEVSNLARPGSGHWYFTLKDRDAQVRCAMFRNRNSLVRTPPRDGEQVVVRGRVSLYEKRGDYQLIVEHMEANGAGALQQQFEALKNRLAAEGLFDPEAKRPLPPYPGRIGIITSPTGAAVRDILHVLERRCPWIPVSLYPCTVQGEGAAASITAAIDMANEDDSCDVLILARGGGSLEDLWSFNDEAVARAVYNSRLPIACGVGHETDFTIADFVADVRAPTPSAAAEIATPDGRELSALLSYYQTRLARHLKSAIDHRHQKLDWLRRRLRNPAERLRQHSQHLDHLDIRLGRAMAGTLADKTGALRQLSARLMAANPRHRLRQRQEQVLHLKTRLEAEMTRQLQLRNDRLRHQVATLNAVSPLATLNRGYAIARDARGMIIRSIAGPTAGDNLQVLLADGHLECTVEGAEPWGEDSPFALDPSAK